MTPPPGDSADKALGEIVAEVSEKASLLVREEIELAKAEITGKVKTLAKGAGVGAAAGVFLVFALVMALHTVAWGIVAIFNFDPWVGFAITTLILVLLGAVAGLLAKKWLSTGAPTPDMAIGEAKATRSALEHQKIERDQLDRSLERAHKE